MTQLRRLFRETSKLFWGAPWLCMPVVLAEACKYSVVTEANSIRVAMLTRIPWGGPEDHLPVLPVIAAILLRTSSWLFGGVLYIYALGMLARAVPQVQTGTTARRAVSWTVPFRLWGTAATVLFMALLSLGLTEVLAGVNVVFRRLASVYWIEVLCFLILLLGVLRPLRRFVDANGPSLPPLSATRSTDFILLLLGFGLSSGSSFAIRYVAQTDADIAQLSTSWYGHFFWIVLACATALPLAFMMIGLSIRQPQIVAGDGDWREPDELSAL